MVDPLTKLAVTYGTDKFGYHDYTPNYFQLFRHLRDRPVRLLEIGVGGYQDADRGGESLEMWREFFPNGRIVGIDIQKKEMDLGDRVKILEGSQVDADFLKSLVHDHGPFDIIIDDGSHRNEHVVKSFELLYPTLAPDGIYVAEDVQTAFFPRFGGSAELSQPNSVGFFADMVRGFDAGDLDYDVARIDRFHNMIALTNSPQDTNISARMSECANDSIRVLEIGFADDVAAKRSKAQWRQDCPKAQVSGVQDPNPTAATWKSLAKENAPYDIVIDHGKAGDSVVAFKALFPALAEGGKYIVSPRSAKADTYFSTLFVHVDHREMAVFFPGIKANPLAQHTYQMERSVGQYVIHRAPNDYPSNFGFEFDHPQVVPALNTMETVLDECGKERGFLLFADIMTRAGDDARSSKMLNKLALLGASSRPYFNLAVRQAKINQEWPKAMELLTCAVKKFPDDARIRSQLGGVFGKNRDWERAEIEFRRGIELTPRNPLLRIQLASALSQMKRADEAVREAAVALELAPDHAGHRVQLGRLQADAGDFEAAEKSLKRAIELKSDMPNAYRQLSRALSALGRNSEARDAMKVALKLAPENPEYKRWQGRLELI